MPLLKYLNYKSQFYLLILGFCFALYNVVLDFKKYLAVAHNVFDFSASIPHPSLTPCFWGMLMFIACLYVAYLVSFKEKLLFQKHLFYMLVGGVVFGWSNVAYLTYIYIAKLNPIKFSFYCTGVVPVNPIYTACFGGTIAFTLSFFLAWFLYRRLFLIN
ncbi:hypothetical protein KC980_00670 [candidate division WWE3 bacterium]|uniref:Uncharacterized protein n=1 Tax=candidate division WWE3 bacterium TaxID=2053526 RepID=A0A955EB06_UNCKA|nr:hypothetical protein [candidate division WWE3 bacterium]